MSNSIYSCANTWRIIIISYLLSQTNSETHSAVAGQYPGGMSYQLLVNTHLANTKVVCVECYNLQGYV